MVDVLFYDEAEFDAKAYAMAFDIISTKLGLCMEKGFINPGRHDYGTVYVLVSEEREHLFKPIIDSHSKFRISMQRKLLDYRGRPYMELRKEFRIRGIYTPFSDVEATGTVEKMLMEEDAKQKQEQLDGLTLISEPVPLKNNLASMIKGAKETANANKRRYRQRVP